MASESSNYIIGFNDGQRGVQGFFSQVYQNDPTYLRGVQLGAAQSTLKAVKASQLAMQQTNETLDSGFAQITQLMRHGQNAILGALDETNGLLHEQIAMERIKNALVDIEPYLVERLDSDETQFAGKPAVVLKAEHELYSELSTTVYALYERIGRVPQISPGGQALARMLGGYRSAISAMRDELAANERAVNDAMDAASLSLLKSGASPLVIAIALDIGEIETDRKAALSTALDKVHPPYRPTKLLTIWDLVGRWDKQGAKTRLAHTKESAHLFESWAAKPKTAPDELTVLRDALLRHEPLSGEIAVSGRRSASATNLKASNISFLMTLMNKGVKAYCKAVASMAAKQFTRLESLADEHKPRVPDRQELHSSFRADLEKCVSIFEAAFNAHKQSGAIAPSQAAIKDAYAKVIGHPEGSAVAQLVGPDATATIIALRNAPFPAIAPIVWCSLPFVAAAGLFAQNDAPWSWYVLIAIGFTIVMSVFVSLRKKANETIHKANICLKRLRKVNSKQ